MAYLPIASTSKSKLIASSFQLSKRSATVLRTSINIRTPPKLPFRGQLNRKDRKFPSTKQAIFDRHVDLLSDAQMAIFIRFNKLSTKELNALRSEVAMISGSKMRMTVIRPTILPPVLRQLAHLPIDQLEKQLHGSMLLVTSDQIDPSSLAAFLRIFNKHAKVLDVQPTVPATAGVKKSEAAKQPDRISLVSAIMEHNKEFDPIGIKEVARLPGLDGLRAQIAALLQQNTQSLVSVLSRLSGGQLAVTLDSYRQSLEKS